MSENFSFVSLKSRRRLRYNVEEAFRVEKWEYPTLEHLTDEGCGYVDMRLCSFS